LIPFWVGDRLFSLEVAFLLVLFYYFVAVPILISWAIPTATDPEDMLRRQSECFEAHVLQLSEKVGVDWSGHLITRIDKLLADGHQSTAVKLYRQETGVTWDDAHLAVENWSSVVPHGPAAPTRLQLRVATLATEMGKTRQSASPELCEAAV
jgi:hypothetical protein